MKNTIENINLKGFNIRDAKCPFCGGDINRYWFDSVIADYAHFVIECYKGVSNDEHHIYRIAIALPETIYIDRKEEDGLKTNEWVRRD